MVILSYSEYWMAHSMRRSIPAECEVSIDAYWADAGVLHRFIVANRLEGCTGAEFHQKHVNTHRFYILVGKRPSRHLLVVTATTPEKLQTAIDFVEEMYT